MRPSRNEGADLKLPGRFDWQHFFFPQIGGRVFKRRSIIQKWIPLGAWFYYCLYAWTTRRLMALVFFIIVPTFSFFMMGVSLESMRIVFALVGIILTGIATGALLRPRVVLQEEYPVRVECGQNFKVRYKVHNRGRRRLTDLSVGTMRVPSLLDLRLSGVTLPTLPAGEHCQVEGEGRATVRGCYRLPPLRYDSDFPSGLWRWGRTDWSERRIMVYPAYTRLVSLELPEGARSRMDVESARQVTRSALEFHGCREYRPGDSLKHIHARSTARLGVPVIREFQAEGRGRTALLVDTWKRPAALHPEFRPDAIIESNLSLAASMVEFLSRSDRILELLVVGAEMHRFGSDSRLGFLAAALDILAAAETVARDPLPKLAPLLVAEIREIESVCLILGGWNEARADLVKLLEAQRIAVKTILVTRTAKAMAGVPGDVRQLSSGAVRRGEVQAL